MGKMKIWVDADACPVIIKDILFRAAERTGFELTLVANQHIRIPRSRVVKFLLVKSGFDAADDEIVKRLSTGDLVVTADIPLAAQAVEKGAYALNPRGEFYTADNIRSRLNVRDFMAVLRETGIDTGGPPTLRPSDRKTFADNLDKFLNRHVKDT